MDQLKLLIKYQLNRVFHNIVILIWIAIATILLLLLFIGVRAEHFPNGVIWSFFKREMGVPYELFFKPFFDFLLYFGIFIFFPIGIMNLVKSWIDPIDVTYFLARPVSRTKFLLSNLLGISIAYTLIIFLINGLEWIFILLISGINLNVLIYQSVLYILIACSLNTFLILMSIVSKSVNVGILFYLLYTLLLSHFLAWRSAGIIWWEKLVNVVLEFLRYILPPADYIKASGLEQTFNFHSILLPIAISFISIIVLTTISITLYRKMEF